MFGDNQIIGKAYFKNSESNKLLVTSRFFTLQGEGPYRGQAAYFIRLAKCNLACSFCDTYFDSGDWFSFEQLLSESETVISDFFAQRNIPTPNWARDRNKKIVLVITGGEPLLQDNLANFLQEAKSYFNKLQIESNGTVISSSLLQNLPTETTLVVSPKCLEKNGKVVKYLEPNKKALDRADCLKFVMSSPDSEQFSAYSNIPNWAHEWAEGTDKDIFISPMNIYNQELKRVKSMSQQDKELSIDQRSEINEIISFWEPGLLDMEQNRRNHEYAAEYCMKYGYILNLQTHLYAGLP